MARKFYLDTAIWRDYFEDRGDGIRPLGEFAFQFLKKCTETGAEIIVSDTVILELKSELSKEQIEGIFNSFKDNIKYVTATPNQHSEAKSEWIRRKRKLPFYDLLHAVIAKHNNAILIARDEHFNVISSILGIEVKKPEDIIYF